MSGTTVDENGNRTTITVRGTTTNHTYDALNRRTLSTWDDGSRHTRSFRPDHLKSSETDVRDVVTSYGYDLVGELQGVSQSLTDTTTATTTFGYDETGNRVRQTDANAHTTSWVFDANKRITAKTLPDGSKEASSYDSVGNLLAKTTFGNQQLAFQYDINRRLTGQVVPAGVGSSSGIAGASMVYGYTALGQLLQQAEQGPTTLNGVQSYEYNANGMPVEVKNPLGQLTYGVDALGHVTELSRVSQAVNAGTVRYEHDEAGRILKVTAPDGKQERYVYDQAGRVAGAEHELSAKDGQPQLLVSHQRYDSVSRPVVIAHVKKTAAGETLLAGQRLVRGVGGVVKKIETIRSGGYDSASGQFSGAPAMTQDFEYDRNARLTREVRTKGATGTDTRYEYDPVGNRTKKTVSSAAGTEIASYTYDVNDRLTQESVSLAAGGSRVTAYTYDGNGNLASKTEPGRVTLYRFDPLDRLIDIRSGATLGDAQAASPSVSYSYDAQGNRVRKVSALGTTGYLIDNSGALGQVALETRGGEAIAYVHGLQLIRQTKVGGSGAEDLLPLQGHLGTSLGAVDIDGNVIEEVDADAFGNLDQPTGLKQAHLYTGQYWDQDAQLLYLRARWYDPKIGRFISADPFEGKQSDPRSLNRMAYAYNDPVHNSDPTGMETAMSLSIGSSATVGMGAAGAAAGKLLMGSFLRKLVLTVGTLAVASIPSSQMEKAKDDARAALITLVYEKARRRRGQILFHYTSPVGAAAILGSQKLICTPTYRGRLGGGITYPAGAYATDIPPWATGMTQRGVADLFFGGNMSKDVSWFAAIDGEEFHQVHGSSAYVRQCPAGDLVDVDVFMIGPNLMNP